MSPRPTRRDVPQGDHDPAQRVAEVVRGLQVELDLVPVRVQGTELELHRRSAPGDEVAEQCPSRRPVLGLDELEDVDADGLAQVEPEDALGRGAHVHQASVHGHHGHHVGFVEHAGPEVRAVGQRQELRAPTGDRPVRRFAPGADTVRADRAVAVDTDGSVDTAVADDGNAVGAVGRQFRHVDGGAGRLDRSGRRRRAGGPPGASGPIHPAHAVASASGRSESHRGWKTCHCSGARRINQNAKKVNADLIIIGITGDGGKIKENIIGSTAIKVARNTDIPVFIIPDEAKYHPIKKISFACDLNKTEESDLIYVSRYFGKLFGAELETINVEEPGKEFSEEKSKTATAIDKKLETIPHKSVFITEKNAGKALEDYFTDHPTDLIMINPRKHNLFHNLFSHSISKELAFHSKVPLLCIH